jgi:hypothetical protein
MYVWKLSVHKACWVKPNDIKSENLKNLEEQKFLAHDKYGQLVFSSWFWLYNPDDTK